MSTRFFRTAFKIAWRDARASTGKFLFVVIAVAIGVGALTGVRGFSQSLATMLLREARTVLAGDVMVRSNILPNETQLQAIRNVERRGVKSTRVTETFSMVSSAHAPTPIPVTVKAIDPYVYPLYGEVVVDPPKPLPQMLTADTVAVSDDLRVRLRLSTGDPIQVGAATYQLAGIVMSEPDRLIGGPGLGPRVLMSQEALKRSELIGLGSRAQQRYLFRAAPGMPVESIRAALKRAFIDDSISDYRQANQNITRALDFCTSFLSLVSLIALIVGGVGVATAMHAHLKQRMDSIAIMKCVGGRASQITQIFVIQTLLLGLAGGLVGVAIGSAVQHIFPPIIQRYFQIKAQVPWVPMSALQGICTGLLTTLLFTVPPLLSVRHIRPSLIFRRDMPDMRAPWRERLLNSKAVIAAGLLIVIGITGVAIWLIGGDLKQAARVAGYFVAGLGISLLLLSGVAWLLMRTLRTFVATTGRKLPASVRHGISNLYRPGSQSTAILIALGVGVMFTLTVYLIQHSILADLTQSAPPGMSNVFLLDVTPEQRDPLITLITSEHGVQQAPELVGTVSARIVSIDGVRPDDLVVGGQRRRFLPRRIVTMSADPPVDTTIVKGAWWKGTPASPEIAMSEWASKFFGVNIGSVIEWDAFGRRVRTRVACIFRINPHRLRARLDYFFSPGTLDGLPAVYYGAARVSPAAVPQLQRAVYAKFPTITVINMADVIQRIQDIINQVSLIIRFISLFAIAAGATILASSVAGTRFRRIREVVIFKTLGATRSRIVQMFSAEFLILGTIAGIMGSLLATGFSAVIIKRLLKTDFHFTVLPEITAVLLTAVIAAAAGWIASYRILGQKPLEVLRGE
jgi:putative ABC transport system permease protein